MKQRPRIYYTESQKALMWEHWKQGDSLQMIAQLFDRNHSSIQRIHSQAEFSTFDANGSPSNKMSMSMKAFSKLALATLDSAPPCPSRHVRRTVKRYSPARKVCTGIIQGNIFPVV